MKGFIRILEAIIASLLLLALLAYFFEPVVKYSKWPDVSESIKAEDALVARNSCHLRHHRRRTAGKDARGRLV